MLKCSLIGLGGVIGLGGTLLTTCTVPPSGTFSRQESPGAKAVPCSGRNRLVVTAPAACAGAAPSPAMTSAAAAIPVRFRLVRMFVSVCLLRLKSQWTVERLCADRDPLCAGAIRNARFFLLLFQ